MWWFVLGVLAGLLGRYLWDFKKAKGLRFKPLEWAGVLAWLAWVASGFIFVVISLGEHEPRAAGLGCLIFGVVALVGLGIMRSIRPRLHKKA
jgi:tryptophan-rich sensory protein